MRRNGVTLVLSSSIARGIGVACFNGGQNLVMLAAHLPC
jgi:hypothetical protein